MTKNIKYVIFGHFYMIKIPFRESFCLEIPFKTMPTILNKHQKGKERLLKGFPMKNNLKGDFKPKTEIFGKIRVFATLYIPFSEYLAE